MWLLGCNLRRDLYILFSVKRIFVTVDRIFIDLCNPRRHKNIWKRPYFIQTRGPWHNLWQIMSFSTLTFCARVWNIANMRSNIKLSRVKMLLAALGPALTAHAWLNQPETRMPRAAERAGRAHWWHYTWHIYCCVPYNDRHMSHLCVSCMTEPFCDTNCELKKSLETRATYQHLSVFRRQNYSIFMSIVKKRKKSVLQIGVRRKI